MTSIDAGDTDVLSRVPLIVHVEGAREVIFTGDFTGWSRETLRLVPHGDDEWVAILTIPPGRYEYRLLVDGEWRDDPEAEERVENPFGSKNCVLRVR